MEYSGAGGKLIYEKNQKQKSCVTVPLTLSYASELNAVLFPQRVTLPLNKCRDMSSDCYAAHPVGYNSPLQIKMAVWSTFF
jgi:hypothetical protein